MKKILILTLYPAPYRVEIINGLIKKYDVDVFFENSVGDDRNKEWFSNINAYYLNTADGKKIYSEKTNNLKAYDLVIFFEYSGSAAIKLIMKCRRKKIPYVINCDGEMLIKHGNPIKDIFKKYLVKGAAAYFASGEHAKNYLLRYGAKEDKIYFHNFTSLYEKDILKKPLTKVEKQNLRKQLSLPQDCKIAIAVGRFIPLKRYDALIRKWGAMRPNDYLLLIGGGEEKEKYEHIVKELSLKNVIIKGFCQFDKLLQYFRAADVFVHPTSYDVWGLVINEAMASGLPIVVSDTCVAGVELVENGKNGFVVSCGNDEALANQVKLILSDDDLASRAANMAIETIKPFTIENMVGVQVDNVGKLINEYSK